MAASLDQSFDFSTVVLDLDEITNIGHPCWELLQPHPNICEMFDEYNQLFFGGVLNVWRTDFEWFSQPSEYESAGLTYPEKNGRTKLCLNDGLLKDRLRREVIEIMLHEMIHVYLIEIGKEDKDIHGRNYKAKMNEIRALTGLNITVEHELTDKSKKDLYSMWRCRENCKYTAPYFGFVWKKTNVEPKKGDMMWIDSNECKHDFERYSDDGDDPKKEWPVWECIRKFNDFVSKHRIRIKTKKLCSRDKNGNRYTANVPFELDISTDGEGAAAAIADNDATGSIPNECYVNFKRETKQFIDVEKCWEIKEEGGNILHQVETTVDSRTVCMICLSTIADETVIEHLKECTGIEFTLDSTESLPIFKMVHSKADANP